MTIEKTKRSCVVFRKAPLGMLFFLILLIFSLSCAQNIDAKKTSKPTTKTEIRTPKGRSFFPFGFYLVSQGLTPQKRIDALRDIAAAGFNTIHSGCSDLDDCSEFLDEAERLDVQVITEFKGIYPLLAVTKLKNQAAIFGWNIADDAGDHETRDQILDIHRQIKAADLNHFTYVSISNWSKKWSEFADVADLIGVQSYPIGYPFDNQPKGLPNNLIEVSYVLNLAHTEADKQNRPVIANLQAFKWPNQRWPTPDEVSNMTYQALLAGVKGILFYTYDDGTTHITENEGVWNRLKSLTPEINKLTPILLEGILTKLDTKNKELLAGQWKYRDNIYFVIVNTSQIKTMEASISMPITKGVMQPLFPGHPSGMTLKDGLLRGFIKPGDVHVYQLLK